MILSVFYLYSYFINEIWTNLNEQNNEAVLVVLKVIAAVIIKNDDVADLWIRKLWKILLKDRQN